jgi:cytochrome P450
MSEHTTSTASGNPDRPYDEEDISSQAFWSTTAEEREKTFARLRERGTITWHPPMEGSLLDDPEDFGFWAVTTYDDLVEVTKRNDDFLSGPGILMESLPDELVESAQSIIAMDPPRHSKMRKLVAAAFTPKQMRRINDRIETNARKVVDNLVERAAAGGGTAEFVAECAELLPMHNINDMMGVPEGDRQLANQEMKVLVGWSDPELVGNTQEERVGRMFQAIVATHQLCMRLADERRQEPQDDLITALVQAEVDGERLPAHDRRYRHDPAVDQPRPARADRPPGPARVAAR